MNYVPNILKIFNHFKHFSNNIKINDKMKKNTFGLSRIYIERDIFAADQEQTAGFALLDHNTLNKMCDR